MASPGAPQPGPPRRWRWIYALILGILTLIVAPFVVEVLKIQYAAWLAEQSAEINRRLSAVDQAIASKRLDEAERLLGDLDGNYPNNPAVREKKAELGRARQLALDAPKVAEGKGTPEKPREGSATEAGKPPGDRGGSQSPGDGEQVGPGVGVVGDFGGVWDVYLGDSLVRRVELGPTPGQSGESSYKEKEGSKTGADYFRLEDGGAKLSLFKTGGHPVERGLVSWVDGNTFDYQIESTKYQFRRRK